MPVHNEDVAAIFDEIADLLELKEENPFRIRAYRRAAQTVRAQGRELHEQVAAGRDLTELPGIGDDLSAKIREILGTGKCKALEKLKHEVPAGLEDLLKLPGLGPKRVRLLRERLRVTSPGALGKAIASGRLRTVAGFGPKLESRLAAALANPVTATRTLRAVAAQYAGALVAHLARVRGVAEVVVAGSFRRGRDTVGDLDVLAVAADPGPVSRAFTGYDEVVEVLATGDTRSSVRLRSGLQVDLRVVPRESFGAALHYFTGSKAHNIRVRRLGQRRGLKINEYGVFRGGRRVAGGTEASVFEAVGLPFIEPELREDRGEFEAAAAGTLPRLLRLDDLRGDLHAHTDDTDGTEPAEAMVEAAQRAGLEYVAITDHSRYLGATRGLDAARLRKQLDRLERIAANARGIAVLRGIEVDILESGELALPDSVLETLDLVVGAVHSHFDLAARKQTARLLRAIDHRCFSILAHPLCRLIGDRGPIRLDMERVISACAARGCFLELNSQPQRLDLPDAQCQLAREHKVLVSVASDAHRGGDFGLLAHGVTEARRGWLEPGDVLNTRGTADVRKLLRRTMR